jgi:hypothetical protein
MTRQQRKSIHRHPKKNRAAPLTYSNHVHADFILPGRPAEKRHAWNDEHHSCFGACGALGQTLAPELPHLLYRNQKIARPILPPPEWAVNPAVELESGLDQRG